MCRKVVDGKDWRKYAGTNWIESDTQFVINADWDVLMCVE